MTVHSIPENSSDEVWVTAFIPAVGSKKLTVSKISVSGLTLEKETQSLTDKQVGSKPTIYWLPRLLLNVIFIFIVLCCVFL